MDCIIVKPEVKMNNNGANFMIRKEKTRINVVHTTVGVKM